MKLKNENESQLHKWIKLGHTNAAPALNTIKTEGEFSLLNWQENKIQINNKQD